MAKLNKTTLKGYFNTGDKPTEEQFANLIDSVLVYQDDFKLEIDILGNPVTEGSLFIIKGYVDVTNLSSGSNTVIADDQIVISSYDSAFTIYGTSAVIFKNVDKIVKLIINCEGLLSFPSATNANNLLIESNTSLTSLDLSALTNANSLSIESNTSLTSLDLSALTNANYLTIYNNTSLTSLDLSALTNANSLSIYNNTSLTSLDLSALTNANYLRIYNNTSLTSLDLSALTNANYLAIYNNTSLTSLDLSGLNNFTGDMYLIQNSLTQDSVDDILVKLASITSWTSGAINLTGGLNATPSATGLAAKTILEERGIEVLVN